MLEGFINKITKPTEGGLLDRTLSTLTGQKHPDVVKRDQINLRLKGLRARLHDLNGGGLAGSTESYVYHGDASVIDDLKAKIAQAEAELQETYRNK